MKLCLVFNICSHIIVLATILKPDSVRCVSCDSLYDSSENTAVALIRLKINDELEFTANDQTEN